MPNRTSPLPLDAFRAQLSRLIAELDAAANCPRWDLPRERFEEGLWRSVERRFGAARPSGKDFESYLKSLHLEDLALACACAEGIEKAWEFFIAHFRQDLRIAAGAMLRGAGLNDEARAAELADSLYADLYGIQNHRGGGRKSLFEYFHGRSKLSTWLRAVLAQRQVDMFRAGSRFVSLESEPEEKLPREPARHACQPPSDPNRGRYLARFDRALSMSLADLTPRERLILACYYNDECTLAEIGRMLHEHESTVSRQLERIRRGLRENVIRLLRQGMPACDGRPAEPGLDEAQVELVFEYALEDSPFDLTRALSAPEAPPGPQP